MPKKTTLVFKKSGPVEVPIPAPIVGDEIVKPQIVEHDVMPRKGIELSAATPGMAGVAPPKEELDRKKKRHEIYDFLASIGAKEMGVSEKNRGRMFHLLNEYADITAAKYKSELCMALRTNEERNKARKQKHFDLMEKRRKEREATKT